MLLSKRRVEKLHSLSARPGAIVHDRFPGFIRVIAFHLVELFERFQPEVLLVNHAVLTDDEGPDSSYVVYSGRSDEGKSADHDTLHYKVHFAKRCRRALSLQNLEEIAMVWFRAARIALFDRAGNVFAHRTIPLAVGVLPSQTILFTRSADDPLRVLIYLVDRALLKSIVVLLFDVTPADFDSIEFILANASIHEFLPPSLAVK
jgi:hypothetical protein